MYVRDIKKELEPYKDWEVILNLTKNGDWEHTYDTVNTFLNKYNDSEEFPFETFDVVYDWDEYGSGDGHNVICFYSNGPGLMESYPLFKRAYGGDI